MSDTPAGPKTPGDSSAAGTAARLTVRRPADGVGDQYRISLKLDGVLIGSLRPGESVARAIASGEHRLRASNTLMREAVTFAADAGEEVRFLVRNCPGLGTAVFAALGAGWLYVALERESPGPLTPAAVLAGGEGSL